MRQKIINSTKKILIKRGYYGISMSNIACECDVHKTTIYHYFESKDQLILTVLNEIMQRFRIEAISIEKYAESNNSRKLSSFYSQLSQYFNINYPGHVLMTILSVELVDCKLKEADRIIKSYFDEWVSFLKRIFIHYCSEKSINSSVKILLAFFTGNSFLKFIGVSNPDFFNMEKCKTLFCDFNTMNHDIPKSFLLDSLSREINMANKNQINFTEQEKDFLSILLDEANIGDIVKKTKLTERSVRYVLDNLSKKFIEQAVLKIGA
jgi:AcrR family transcriptional regulator